MVRGDAQTADRLAVIARGIAHVLLPAVALVALGQLVHEPVTRHLRHDRGAGDSVRQRIAVDDRGVWPNIDLAKVATVDQRVVDRLDAFEGPPHRQVRRAQDVDFVDLGNRRCSNADGRRATQDLGVQPLALWQRQRLRVPDARDLATVRLDNQRASHDGPSQTGHAHFVHTCHAPRSRSPERPLAAKRGYDHALVERASRWGAAVRRSLMRAALPVSPRR